MIKNLLYLMPLLKAYKMGSIFVVMVLFIEIAFESFLPLSFKLIVDYAIVPKDKNLLVSILILVIIFAILATSLGIYRERVVASISSGVIKDIYNQLFKHLHKLSMSFFSKTKSADILALFNIHLKSVENLVVLIPYAIMSVLGLIVNLVILFFYNGN